MLTTSGGLGFGWKDVGGVAKKIASPAASLVKKTAVDTTKHYASAAVNKATGGASQYATAAYKKAASSSAVQKTLAAKKAADKYLAVDSATKGSPVQQDAARRLQAALATLGKIAKSPSLSAIKVDGAIGPKTAAAVNLAFTKHLGPGQAPAQYRTGKMPLSYIKANANTLAEYIETEIQRRGGQVASAGLVSKAGAIKSINTTIPTLPVTKADVKRLQLDLVTLGKMTGSKQLKAIKVDGALGAKTVAAVNWAFTNHIGSGQAPAQYRTGALTLADVKNSISSLSSLIETETRRRGGKAVTKVAGTAKKIKTRTGETVTAQKVETDSGTTYEVTDSSGHTYFTADPTNPSPPTPPEGLPEPSEEQSAVAAEASAAAAKIKKAAPVVSPEQIPSEEAETAMVAAQNVFTPPAAASSGGGSFFEEHKWAIIGGLGGVAALAVLLTALRGRGGNRAPRAAEYIPPTRQLPAPKGKAAA